MHQGCIRWRRTRREAGTKWWWTWPSSRRAGRPITPARLPRTARSTCLATGSTCLATGSRRGDGTAPVPPASASPVRRRPRHSGGSSRAATPTPASCSAVPTAAMRCPPLTWCCGRLRASRSSTAGGGRGITDVADQRGPVRRQGGRTGGAGAEVVEVQEVVGHGCGAPSPPTGPVT
jgi:hypothetical protein